jgi:hypothetical protein
MSKIIRLTESDLTRIVKRVINESDNKDQYYIVAYPKHLNGNGMFIYTGDDGYSMIPTSSEFRRRMHLEMDSPPKSYETRAEALVDLKQVKKGTKSRPEIRWEIVRF